MVVAGKITSGDLGIGHILIKAFGVIVFAKFVDLREAALRIGAEFLINNKRFEFGGLTNFVKTIKNFLIKIVQLQFGLGGENVFDFFFDLRNNLVLKGVGILKS